MKNAAEKRLVQDLLDHAGVRIDGDRPYDIQVHNPDLYPRVIAGGSLALGEGYMDGWWDCEALDQFFDRIMGARLDKKVRQSKAVLWAAFKARLTNPQSRARAFEIGERHYDIGNDLFTVMLDKRLNYSCAYWQAADTLDEAQEAKLELTCRKLDLRPGLRVLDIGCGWGGFAIYAAEKYGAEVTGITVSREQVKLARRLSEGLPVKIELQDYRDLQGTLRPHRFDRHVRACGGGQLPDLHAGGSPLPEERRSFFTAHHRRQLVGSLRGPLGCKIYFSKFDAALGPADHDRGRGTVRSGRLAQFRSPLRSHADGVAPQRHRKLAPHPGSLRSALLPHVDVLPAFMRRLFSGQTEPALADRFFRKRPQARLSFNPIQINTLPSGHHGA